MTPISSIRSFTLDLPPSCIAFCPTQPQYFVVGTYYLHGNTNAQNEPAAEGDTSGDQHGSAETDTCEKEAQERSGSLILFRLQGDEITHIATEVTPDFAILHIQWSPHVSKHGDLLAVATSTGLLLFYELRSDDGTTHLLHNCSTRVCKAFTLVLSLAWHPGRADVVGVTLSDGRVCICESSSGRPWAEEATVSVTTVHEHSLEAWTLAFQQHDSTTDVLSGGDDLVLQRSTLGEGPDSVPQWQDRRIHQAGVTAILPLAANLVVTGSYDDHIRLISAAPAGRRQVLAEANLGGGVWRLKMLDMGSEAEDAHATASASAALSAPTSLIILASYMHAGTRVVRLRRSQEDQWTFDVLASFEEHKSMNYGSDVQAGGGRVKTIVSTSFYDKLLCLWRFDDVCTE